MATYADMNNTIHAFTTSLDIPTDEDIKKAKDMFLKLIKDLDHMTFEEMCDCFATMNQDLKFLISERQKITAPWKSCTKEVERKFYPIVHELEAAKETVQERISNAFFDHLDEYTNEYGEVLCDQKNVCIREAEPKHEFAIKDLKAVPEEFVQPNEEALEAYVSCFGKAPEGIEMKTIRRCTIVTKKKKPLNENLEAKNQHVENDLKGSYEG